MDDDFGLIFTPHLKAKATKSETKRFPVWEELANREHKKWVEDSQRSIFLTERNDQDFN